MTCAITTLAYSWVAIIGLILNTKKSFEALLQLAAAWVSQCPYHSNFN